MRQWQRVPVAGGESQERTTITREYPCLLLVGDERHQDGVLSAAVVADRMQVQRTAHVLPDAVVDVAGGHGLDKGAAGIVRERSRIALGVGLNPGLGVVDGRIAGDHCQKDSVVRVIPQNNEVAAILMTDEDAVDPGNDGLG